MHLFVLVVGLDALECHDFALPGEAMLLDHRIMNMPAIHAAMTGRPHMSDGALKIQEMILYHETPAT
jgi:hypothetical protein